jgi:hypothetical protein
MKTPGFSAEASLYKTRGHYHCMAMSGCSKGQRDVISQLKGSVSGRAVAGVLELLKITTFAHKIAEQPTTRVSTVAKVCAASIATET